MIQTLRQKIRRERKNEEVAAQFNAHRAELAKRLTHAINRAAVAKSDRWGDVRQRVEDREAELKEYMLTLDPVAKAVEVARVQGGITELRGLLAHFDNAHLEVEQMKQQTMG